MMCRRKLLDLGFLLIMAIRFRLIEFLLGETDGTPREPRHLFRLYMAKRQFSEAAKTAVKYFSLPIEMQLQFI